MWVTWYVLRDPLATMLAQVVAVVVFELNVGNMTIGKCSESSCMIRYTAAWEPTNAPVVEKSSDGGGNTRWAVDYGNTHNSS